MNTFERLQCGKRRLDFCIYTFVYSLLNDRTKAILEYGPKQKGIFIDYLSSCINRMFDGKQIIKLKSKPRWIIYAIKEIGYATGWWTVKWSKKYNRHKRGVRYNSCGDYRCYCVSYSTNTYKTGNAVFMVNMDIRNEVKRYKYRKRILIVKYLEKIISKENVGMFPKDIINMILDMYINSLGS